MVACRPALLIPFALLLPLLPSCAPAPIRAVRALRAAEERGDFAAARSLLGEDPRIWWEAREGSGSPWTPGEGRWREWDRHFRGRGVVESERVTAEGVELVIDETNDYYLLTERGAQPYLRSYFIDDAGRIAGTMVSALPDSARPAGRAREFDAWLRATHPEEAEYLRPGGEIDPTGDRAERTRAMLVKWRRATGLPELDLGG